MSFICLTHPNGGQVKSIKKVKVVPGTVRGIVANSVCFQNFDKDIYFVMVKR